MRLNNDYIYMMDFVSFYLIVLVSFFFALLIFFLSYLLILKGRDIEKITSYECGFEPFEDTRSIFDVKFYLVGILFLIFDLEVIFLFPWVVSLFALSFFGFFVMFFFVFFLGLIYVYEWLLGALDWS